MEEKMKIKIFSKIYSEFDEKFEERVNKFLEENRGFIKDKFVSGTGENPLIVFFYNENINLKDLKVKTNDTNKSKKTIEKD